MLSADSILRRLPPNLDRKQVLFLDGLRHAAEMIDLGYTRLRATLTQIALDRVSGTKEPTEFTGAFLDAWAVVDAIDRFRLLLHSLPGAQPPDPTDEFASYVQHTEQVRKLRNVADHLAQRADYVVACAGTALGELSWYTALDPGRANGLSCVIVPGTLQAGKRLIVNPLGHALNYPTDMIHLAAGEHRACLSDVLPMIAARVRCLEASLQHSLTCHGLAGQQAGTDLLVAVRIQTSTITRPPDDPHKRTSS